MSTESKKSEGRGLPVGFAWRPEGKKWTILVRDGASGEVAQARNDGRWLILKEEGSRVLATGTAQPRPDESAGAAAQREAEAALWRAGVFGPVGNPRCPDCKGTGVYKEDHGLGAVETLTCPCAVDAVRAPAEPAPLPEGVACLHECPDGSEPAGLRCGLSFGHLGDHRARDEKGRTWHWTDEGAAGEPAPREPSAPTDGELARLLPGLRRTIDFLAEENPGGIAPHTRALRIEAHEDARRARELLLAERARMIAEGTEKIADRDCDIAMLRARVAELEAWVAETERKIAAVSAEWKEMDARLSEAKEQLRIVSAGIDDVWRWQGDGHDDPASLACPVVMSASTLREFVAARERVAELTATPPPGTIAALLRAVEEARDAARDKSGAHSGESPMAYRYEGMRDAFDIAADIICATLGAPSPLDAVVAEVCAVRLTGSTDATSDDLMSNIGDLAFEARAGQMRNRFLVIGRLALAGALVRGEEEKGEAEEERAAACDAKGGA